MLLSLYVYPCPVCILASQQNCPNPFLDLPSHHNLQPALFADVVLLQICRCLQNASTVQQLCLLGVPHDSLLLIFCAGFSARMGGRWSLR